MDGVTVQRGVCGGHLIESCRGFLDENLEKYLALPGPMSAANEMRHFVQFSTSRELSPKQHFSHRSQFVLPIAGTCEAVLKCCQGRAARSCRTSSGTTQSSAAFFL